MKSRMLSTKIIPLFLILSLLSLGSISCGTAYEDLVIGILVEWADAHDINPSDVGGATNLAKRAASGSTGDEEADAAIGLVETIRDVQVGDRLLGEGEKLQTEGKPVEAAKRMDEAIARRPDDWSYRITRATLAFQSDDGKKVNSHWFKGARILGTNPLSIKHSGESFEENTHPNPSQEMNFYTQTIDEWESDKINVSEMSRQTKVIYYEHLHRAYLGRHEAGKLLDTYTEEQAAYDLEMANHCFQTKEQYYD